MPRLLFILLLIVHFPVLLAQDAQPDAYQDSLSTILQKEAPLLEKKEALFLLGEHLVQRHPERAEEIANQLLKEYHTHTDSLELLRTQYILAASHRWQGDYSSALSYYQDNYNYAKRHQDSLNMAKSGHFIGTLNTFLGNNVVAQNHLLEVAAIYEKMGTPKQKAGINNSLASFYMNIDQVEKGKERYHLALAQYEALNDSVGMANTNANLGMLYTDLGDFEKAEMHLMRHKAYNQVFPTLREMGFHHDFLGYLRQKQGRLDEALEEHLKALRIRENLSSTYNLCESKLNMGEVLIKLGRYPEAISHLKDVFKYDEHESLYQQQTASELLSEAYEKSGNYKESLAYFKQYKTLSDSIYSKESLEIIAEKDAQYEKQENDAKIALLKQENDFSESELARSKNILIWTVVALVLFLIAAIALYQLYRKIKAKNRIITKALKDRELLLHETHHRVKNNLQMISSLLNLQSKYVADAKAYEVLQNGRNRVQSMAILHKNLYSGNELTEVPLQTYFTELVQHVFDSYHKSESEITTHIDADAIVMEVESVVPIGLIVNELVTNALKHAFPASFKEQPHITITMKENKEAYQLTVADNGVGYEHVMGKKQKNESFGQRLIQSLCQKLKAKVTMENKEGTKVVLTIPKKSVK